MKSKTEPLAPVSPAVIKSVHPGTTQQISFAGPTLDTGSNSLPRELQQLKNVSRHCQVSPGTRRGVGGGGAVPGEEWLTQANSQHSTQRGPSKMPGHITPLPRWPHLKVHKVTVFSDLNTSPPPLHPLGRVTGLPYHCYKTPSSD